MDKTEALAAVKNDGNALENVSDELKADKEVVMAAETQEKLAEEEYQAYLKKIRQQN